MVDSEVENMFDTLAISEVRDEGGSRKCKSDGGDSQITDFVFDTPPDSPGHWSYSGPTLLNEDESVDITAANDYFGTYQQIVEQDLAFDYENRNKAAARERTVDEVFRQIRDWDAARQSHNTDLEEKRQSQSHAESTAEKLLSDTGPTEKSELLKIMAKMPKGAHLHVHFNAHLPPKVLLDIAKGVDPMFITGSLPLISENDFESFDKCDIALSISSPKEEKSGSLFETGSQFGHTMKLSAFVDQFPKHYTKVRESIDDVDNWLLGKLLSDKTGIDRSLQSPTRYVLQSPLETI